MSYRKTLCEVQAAPANASPSTGCITETDIVAKYPDLFEGVGLLDGDVHSETDPTVLPVQMPLRRLPVGIRNKYIYRVVVQISLQTAEAALDFRFDHFIVNISIRQKFAVDKMNVAKTAVSHSGSEAWSPVQSRGPGQGPTSPMPRAGSGCIH